MALSPARRQPRPLGWTHQPLQTFSALGPFAILFKNKGLARPGTSTEGIVASIEYSQVRKGMVIVGEDNQLYHVVDRNLNTPGNWRAILTLKLKNLGTGNVTEKRFKPDDKVEQAYLDKREMQYIYQDGDGFQSRVDPTDPNIVYSEYQYGGLARYDRRTGESVGIQPQAGKGEPPLRWNWDSPLLISPHSHTRLYFGSKKLFRSDDRGESWRCVGNNLPPIHSVRFA